MCEENAVIAKKKKEEEERVGGKFREIHRKSITVEKGKKGIRRKSRHIGILVTKSRRMFVFKKT